MGQHENFGQLDARLRQALDYDDSAGAPSSSRAAVLWVPASGKFAPREVLLVSDYGVASGVAPLDAGGAVPIANLPVANSGTSSTTQIVRANDARLSNNRTPSSHASTHASNGSDPVTPSGIGAVATSALGANNGVCPLDSSGLVPYSDLPVGSGTAQVAQGSHTHTPAAIGAASSSHSHPLVLFQGRQTTSQTMAASGTTYAVLLQAEDYDTDNGHSTSTNISRWTCARAGTYQVDGAVAYPAGSALRNAQINRNGAVVPGSFNQQAASSTSLNIIDAKQVFVDLAVGDYIELATVQTQGTNIATTVNASVNSVLRIRSLTLF